MQNDINFVIPIFLGSYRYLEKEEVEQLWKLAGGKQKVFQQRITALVNVLNSRTIGMLHHDKIAKWFRKYQLQPHDFVK